MRAAKAEAFQNISATTSPFFLIGGKYQIMVTATFGGGNVVLQRLGPDGTTYVSEHTAITSNAVASVDLPPGWYKFTVTTATAVYASVDRVPGE